ncbi:tRNA 4-thiouridine(8) synthase ThiI [Candidatus Macondimonas diazotrophica]|nr:tRNA 4-thiouridine(8) synthase ThiI [Candidatus Macondimonas diazotrophica]HBG31761.1 tRNA 4-thiouridine(8) synthase ThiI [Gammaproteobacteria bacterium]HBG50823.1 tRNA 4-thiouridine(8) synthase ThiI [Gammaproteobacteria bacterium]
MSIPSPAPAVADPFDLASPFERRILVHYGEVALKGRNRIQFEQSLQRTLHHRLRMADVDATVELRHDRLCVRLPPAQTIPMSNITALLREVPGIVNFAPAFHAGVSALDPEAGRVWLGRALIALAADAPPPGAGFAVRVNRAYKKFPLPSTQLERELGSAIALNTPWKRVDLTTPARTFHVDILRDGLYCHIGTQAGLGGLPLGSAGHVLALLSGGIDSPVAACLMAKRGCTVDLLHMTPSHLVQQQIEETPVAALAQQISRYAQRCRLFVLPYTHFDLAIPGDADGYGLLLFRRFLARAGAALAWQIRARAMVSGDSLGQVASQTLENLVSTSQATDMPILRPLIADDKQEIINLARRLGTYALSLAPYKDCCALLSRNPRTRSRAKHLAALEQELIPDYPALIQRTLDQQTVLTYDCGRRIDAPGDSNGG